MVFLGFGLVLRGFLFGCAVLLLDYLNFVLVSGFGFGLYELVIWVAFASGLVFGWITLFWWVICLGRLVCLDGYLV